MTNFFEATRTAKLLWILTGLFCLRVLGQVLVEFLHVRFLPPSEEWFSGLLPYPQLLASQILIIALQIKIDLDFTRQTGWSYQPRRLAGTLVLPFGAIYLTVMLIRYAIRMSLYPHERWTGGSIPIFFHWVLSLYVLLVGYHHWRQTRRLQSDVTQTWLRRWSMRGLWFAAWSTISLGIAVWSFYLLLPSLLAEHLGIRRAEFAVRIERTVPVSMSDGIALVADIYHPRRAGLKMPTVLVRIPYSKTMANKLIATVIGRLWAERGYTVVIQGTRGRYDSGGEYYPLRGERQDGIETLDWLAAQPWYDGRLGMWGASYFGYTQWVLADRKNPGPTALIIQESSTDFHRMFYPGGAFSLKSALFWALWSYGKQDVLPTAEAMQRGIAGFPLIESDDRGAQDISFFDDWAKHTERDAYSAQIDGDDRAKHLQAPVLLMAGWYDPFLPTQLADYARIRQEAAPHVARETRLVIGPWAHAQTAPLPDGAQPRNFRLECFAPTVEWFDRLLLHQDIPPPPPVRIYTIGADAWRDEQEWPLARTVYTPYYLHAPGSANTIFGRGMLTSYISNDAPDIFYYDPRNPVPTAGGAMLGNGAGSERQNDIEKRSDVLVYTTESLQHDVEVTGPIELILHVTTTAPSTDFTAKLVDVFPDDSAWNISEGILRRRYDEPSPPRGPDGSTEIRIALWPTSTLFKEHHKIRLEVSSSNYPRFDRNPNTGRTIPTETTPIPATQTVWHSAEAPSRLILPIIPQGSKQR